MTVVDSGDVTAYRAAKRATVAPVLNLEPLTEWANAEVDVYVDPYQAPHSAIATINESADFASEDDSNRLFRIERPTGEIVCWGVARKQSGASTFYPDVKSHGDFGYATNEALNIETDDVIRIYTNAHLWAMVSRVGSDGTQYKRWDVAYSDQGATPPPVVNMGADQQQFVDPTTALATFSFDASESFDWLEGVTAQGGIAAYAWTLPTGATITAGGAALPNITFTIAAGIYRVSCTVTNNNSKTATGHRWIFANDHSANAPFSETYSINAISGDLTDDKGWEAQFVVLGDISSEVFPGQKALFTAPVSYDGAELDTNASFSKTFVGYVDNYAVSTEASGLKTTTLFIKSPLKICHALPSATQFIEEAAQPSAWTEVRRGLCDPAYAAFYLLKYHTTVLDYHDFLYEADIRLLRRRVFGFNADVINNHLETVGAIMSGDIGCRSDGTITLTQKPELQNDADRDARDTKFTWQDADLRDRLVIQAMMRSRIAYLIMAAVAFDGDLNKPMPKFASKAPGRAQAQGTTKTDLPDISVSITGGAAELYRIIGHWFAYLNNPLEKINVLPSAMWEVCEPADADWHVLDISTDYLPLDLDKFGARWATDQRFRPTQVQRSWSRNGAGWVKELTVIARMESYGLPGVFHPTYRGEIAPFIGIGGWIDGLNITMPELDLDLSLSLPTVSGYDLGFAYNNVGLSEVADSFNGNNPSWDIANTGLTGDVITQCLDQDTADAGYMVVYDSSLGKVRIYHNPDLLADPTDWTLQGTITVDATFQGSARIVNNTDLTALALLFTDHVQIYRRPSGGAWDAGTLVGNTAPTDSTGAKRRFGLALDGATQYCIGRENTNDGYKVYKATAVAGAFTAIANHPGANGSAPTPQPAIQVDGSGNLVVSYNVSSSVSGSDTFQRSDWQPGSGGISRDAVYGHIRSSDLQDVDGTVSYGAYTRFWTAEQALDITYTVSRLAWLPGSAIAYPLTDADDSAPTYYPPNADIIDFYNATLQARAVLYDPDGSVVGSTPWYSWTTVQAAAGTLQALAASGGYPESKVYRVIPGIDYTWSVEPSGVAYLETETVSPSGRDVDGDYRSTALPQTGSFTHLSMGGGFPASGNVLYVSDKANVGEHLYAVNTSTEVWTDITPVDGNNLVRSVKRWNAIAVFGTSVVAIVTDANGEKTLITGNVSGSWSDVGATRFNWIRTLDGSTKFVAGGETEIAVSVNNLASWSSRIRGWRGSQETIEDCLTGGYAYEY